MLIYLIGTLFQDLLTNNLFQSPQDMALLFSTDGLLLFKSRARFETWPLVVQNLNLLPVEHLKDENLILLGKISGPGSSQDIDSFLWPFIEECEKLEKGIFAWDAYHQENFIFRTHLVLVCADMPAHYQLMGSRSQGAYPYCPYCNATAIRGRGYCYCPLTKPED